MDENLISKVVVSPGKGPNDYKDGAKMTFHIKTETCEAEPKLIDDSRQWKEPMELMLGKKFKLEVLEACIRTMRAEEIAAFSIDKSLLATYPIVSKTLREAYSKTKIKKEKKPHHCCGMGLKEGLGYPDLDQLVKEPLDLKLTIELLKVADAGSYEKEFWAMNEDERIASIPELREAGNDYYKAGDHAAASAKYSEALGRLEQLMVREKPGEEEWERLRMLQTPLLLNFSQCQIVQGQYYSAIEHCTTVLDKEPKNVKALFRRGRAHLEVFNPTEARRDLGEAASLDPSLAPAARKLLVKLAEMEAEKNNKDRTAFSKMFTSS